jgi:hypothetical protein
VPSIEAVRTLISPQAQLRLGELIAPAADEMPEGVATERITAQQANIRREDHGSYPDSKVRLTRDGIDEPHCLPDVMRQENEKNQS